MSLSVGTRLGSYEVLGLIGAGGMGEVYTARDTRLDRTVAIKVLPADMSADPDRRARFEREAKSIAALAHPHICTLHDVGEHAGSMFLVMEHLALVTVDRQGRVSVLPSPARFYGPSVRVSPDGRKVALTISDLTEVGVWLDDLGRGVFTSLHRRGEASWPVWSPDGQHVVFQWLNEGRFSLVWQRADGSASPEVLPTGHLDFGPSSWAPGGHLLGMVQSDVWVAMFEKKPGRVEPLLRTAENENGPEMSPDGRWLAYGSNASGRFDIYVQPFPGRGARTIVAENGWNPAWHPKGRELFYLTAVTPERDARRMMAVDFTPGTPPRIGTPRLLFEFDRRGLAFSCEPLRCFDVAPDGQRFYVVQTPTPPPPPVVTEINLVLNWFEELKAKVPVGK